MTVSTRPSAARGATRRNRAPRSACFRFRDADHRWDPKNQRPELWRLYNTRITSRAKACASFRCPTGPRLDVWDYIARENIPVVPLYFAKERPVVERDGMLIMVDDERMRLLPGEKPRDAHGPFPHAGLLSADRSDREHGAPRCADIIAEMRGSRSPSGKAG